MKKGGYWTYQIIRHEGDDGFEPYLSLHEVYCKDGKIYTMTAHAVCFDGFDDEGKGELIASLEMALADAKRLPILDENEVGA